MAIDRNIITWSLDDIAFKAKSYVEIFNMLLENYRAIHGSDIDLGVETAFGEELRMEAEMLYDMAKIAQDVYYTLDVNNAKGAILDNIVAFTSNITRKQNIQTVMLAELTFSGTDVNLDVDNAYIQDVYGILWKIKKLEGNNILVANSSNYVELTSVSYGENLQPSNTPVQMLVNNSFHSNSITLSAPIYVQIGSILETDEMLRERKNNTMSYNSVGLLDSIRDYILKNIHSVKDVMIYNSNGKKTSASSTDSAGNTLINLLLSNNSAEEDLLIPRHDLLVLIQPQIGLEFESFWTNGTPGSPTNLSKSIAQVLKQKIIPGIATTAQLLKTDGITTISDANYISVDIAESYRGVSLDEEYRFYIVNAYSPSITVNLLPKNNYDPATTRIRIREAIYELSTKYLINQDIDLGEIYSTVMNCNLDPLNPSFIPTAITVGAGAADLKVNNGYWLVDKSAANYGITIEDEE